MKSILVIDTPSSCDKCKLCETTELILDFYNEIHICSLNSTIQIKERYEDMDNEVIFNTKLFDFRNERHPNCPLIELDMELLERVYSFTKEEALKATMDKLKGVE